VGVREDVAGPSGTLPEAAEVTATAVPSPPPPSEASSPASPAGVRRFEMVEGSSEKFWEIVRDGVQVTVRYGRIGSNGQAKTKAFADEAAARVYADGLIEVKVGKGYREA
ncbi:WGR domain-containing protein, partial [Singulisphaera rosea]